MGHEYCSGDCCHADLYWHPWTHASPGNLERLLRANAETCDALGMVGSLCFTYTLVLVFYNACVLQFLHHLHAIWHKSSKHFHELYRSPFLKRDRRLRLRSLQTLLEEQRRRHVYHGHQATGFHRGYKTWLQSNVVKFLSQNLLNVSSDFHVRLYVFLICLRRWRNCISGLLRNNVDHIRHTNWSSVGLGDILRASTNSNHLLWYMHGRFGFNRPRFWHLWGWRCDWTWKETARIKI